MAAKLMAWLIFGLIGMAAFAYGKKQRRPKILMIAGVLMLYPYFVDQALLLWGVGIVLTVGLFVIRD